MDRYIEMGFSEQAAEAAVERYSDDLHAGCHWLMTRESMGSVPKRLKTSHRTSRTYLGSSIRFEGQRFSVDEFDDMHALIRIRSETSNKARWEHIGDGRMEWIQVQHNQNRISIPRYAWKRKVGTIYFPLEFIEQDHRIAVTQANALNMFIRYGRPGHTSGLWPVWRAMACITKEHVHEPSGIKPRTCYSNDIHEFRVELMTYFHAICDVYGITHEEFDDCLFNKPLEELLSKFPENVHGSVTDKQKKWKNPTLYMKRDLKEWRKNCLPVVLFECERIQDSVVHFSVQFHSMTFIRPSLYEPGIHLQFQRLFFHLWPEKRPKVLFSGPMNGEYLEMVLQASQKKHIHPAEPSSNFVSELMPYQKQCLRWLIEREMSVAASTSAWGWEKHQLIDGFVFYTSVFGHLSLSPPNNQINGGLLAQDVGMGKTVEMLSLIATNKAPGPTLVVVPTTMLGPWQLEASKHTPSLSVVRFHGARRPKDMNILKSADIVLTTYRVVVNETSQHVPTIGSVKWGRIILDESHEMKTTQHATTKAIKRLFAPYRWCVSATPWPRDMAHVNSMLSFLGVSPFDEATLGSYSPGTFIIRNGSTVTPTLFHNILTASTYFQKKRHVRLGLPPVSEHIVHIKNAYQDIYNHLLDVIGARIAEDEADSTINNRTRILHYLRWLRLAATHPMLNRLSNYGVKCLNSPVRTESREIDSFLETLSHTNYDQSLRDIITSWRNGNERCSVCLDAMDRPTLTPCHHMFCLECIQSAYQHDPVHKKCPLCRKSAGTDPLEELKLPEDFVNETVEEEKFCYLADVHGNNIQIPKNIHQSILETEGHISPKFELILQMLESSEKFIIFTQFHSVWKLLCKTLDTHKIKYASIEGSMSPTRRTKAIENFQNDPTVKVFAMTTKTASVGITLTAGSQIIFLEPCLDEKIKKQAIGRAWRIGQTKRVQVTTLQTENTIDLYDMQGATRHARAGLGAGRGAAGIALNV